MEHFKVSYYFENDEDEVDFVKLDFDNVFNRAQVNVFNVLGRLVETINIENNTNKIEVGQNWNSGVYLINLKVDGKNLHTLKLVKQ